MTREELVQRIRGRAGLAATLAVLGALGFGGTSASAATTVDITDASGRSVSVDLRALAGDEDVDSTYRTPAGNAAIEGFRVNTVLNAADANPSWSRFDASSGANRTTLGYGQATRDDAFDDGPAVFYIRSGDAAFLRPSTGGNDRGQLLQDDLDIELSRGAVIDLQIQAPKGKITEDEKVTFTADYGDYAGRDPDIVWGITGVDGSFTGRTLRRSFVEGDYGISATARDSSGDSLGSTSTQITVGEPKKKGPDRTGGGDRKDNDAPDGGASDGRRGEGGSGTGDGSGTGPGTGSGPGSDGAASEGAAASDAAQQRAQARAADGQRIVGELLSGPGATAATADDGEEESQPTEARTGFLRETEEPFTVPGVAIGIAAMLALLGLGAAAEYERLPRFVRVREKLKGAVAGLPGVHG